MSKQFPVRAKGQLQVMEVLTHPMASSETSGTARDQWKYNFLRVTRFPTPDRPDSGRILVENRQTGNRTEHYALLFNVSFQVA